MPKTKSKNMIKIALFNLTPWSITSLLIAIVTRCPQTHAAIQINGKWYDSSETRGDFNRMEVESYEHRYCMVWTLKGDLSNWLSRMHGKKYGWKGVIGWKFGWGGDKQFYCFKTVSHAMNQLGVETPKSSLSGCHIKAAFNGAARYQKFGEIKQ